MSVHTLYVPEVEVEHDEVVTAEEGANSLEYAIVLAVACAFAAVLLAIIQSAEISSWLTHIIKSAFDLFK